MNYVQFKNTIEDTGITVFSKDQIKPLFDLTDEGLKSLLRRYKQRKYIQNPKRGVFYFSDEPIHPYQLAYKLYNPSYISFETALSYYGIIPEVVYTITSACTKPTREFVHKEATYKYIKIKKEAFAGFIKKDEFLIAEPEKAVADYLYLVSLGKKKLNDRLKIAGLNKKEINRYCGFFSNKFLDNLSWRILQN